MKYQEYLSRNQLSKEELISIAWGSLIDDPPEGGCGALPAPPFLMFDRVVDIRHEGARGRIVAEQDIHFDHWYFQCHFRNDPVQPGCLGVDAVWQLMGLYMSVRGSKGTGRALGSKEIEFSGQIRPFNKVVRYEIDIRRYVELPASKSSLCIGNAKVLVDDELVYTISDAKVGMFLDIRYEDYPHKSERSIGGKMNK